MNRWCCTFDGVMLHIWMCPESHLNELTAAARHLQPRMNESRHTHTSVVFHVWISHVTHMSHVTRMNESRHTHTSVVPHVRISHVTQALQNILTYIYISCPHKWIIEYHIELNYVARSNHSCLAGTKALQKIGTMSGGEKARVALSMFVLVPHNLLILGGL